MKRRIRWFIFAAGLLLMGWQSFAKPKAKASPKDGYRVAHIEGAVQAWRPFAVAWSKLNSKSVIEEGTLVSLSDHAKIKLLGLKDVKAAVFDLHGPLLFRVEAEALRKIKVSKTVRAQAQKNSDDKKREEDIGPTFNEAWQRISATFMGQDAADGKHGAAPPQSVGVSGGIDLFLPQQTATMAPNRAPQDIRLSWTSTSKAKSYRVIVKRPNGEKAETVAETALDHQYIKLTTPGIYTVKVESTDGSMRSIEHQIEMLTPLSEVPGEGVEAEADASQPLVLIRPANGLRLVGLKPPFVMAFTWLDRQPRRGRVTYQLTVTTRKGVRVAGTETTEQTASLSVPIAAPLLWYVERYDDGAGEGSTRRSVVATLDPSPAKDIKLSALLESESSLSVYMGR